MKRKEAHPNSFVTYFLFSVPVGKPKHRRFVLLIPAFFAPPSQGHVTVAAFFRSLEERGMGWANALAPLRHE